MNFLVALGNPGEEYLHTRHNAGRIVLEEIRKKINAGEFQKDKRLKALVTKGEMENQPVMLVEPDNFMNNSGESVKKLIDEPEKISTLVVIYDDLDIPIGKIKISFNRSSGGHNGVESIINHLKSEEFLRIRIGICPVTSEGELDKPMGEENVEKFILGKFRESELETLQKISTQVFDAIKALLTEGKEIAMTKFN